MNDYKKVIVSLREFKTLTSHVGDLGKIMAKTEDEQLRSMINAAGIDITNYLANLAKQKKNRSTPISLGKSRDVSISKLTQYCEKMIATEKPEWQILAEKNGWSPPAEK